MRKLKQLTVGCFLTLEDILWNWEDDTVIKHTIISLWLTREELELRKLENDYMMPEMEAIFDTIEKENNLALTRV